MRARHLLVVAGACLATLTLTVGAAVAAPTPPPVPPKTSAQGGPTDPATIELMRREAPLHQAADQLFPLTNTLPGYAGVIASVDKAMLTLYWKGTVPKAAHDAVAAVNAKLGSRAHVVVAPSTYSLAELKAESHRLIGTITPSGQIVVAGPLADGSGLQVRVDDTSSPAPGAPGARTLAPIQPPGPPVVSSPVNVIVETGPPITASFRWNDTPPFWAGGAMYKVGTTTACSTGFAVRDANQHQFLLTAGHCGNNGDQWGTPAGLRIGTTVNTIKNWDTMVIDAPSDGVTWNGGTDPTGRGAGETTSLVTGWSVPTVGLRVCQSGAYSGARCGIAVTKINQTFYLEGFLVQGGVFAEKDDRTSASGSGDSGGPVFTQNNPNSVTANGIVSGTDSATAVPCTGVIQPSRRCAWRMVFIDIGAAQLVTNTAVITR